jgi:hypothetical protein
MSEASRRGIDLGLTEDELAFYDALEVNDSAVQVLGDETLKTIAQELVKAIRSNVTIDWTEREAVRAKLRVMVKRLKWFIAILVYMKYPENLTSRNLSRKISVSKNTALNIINKIKDAKGKDRELIEEIAKNKKTRKIVRDSGSLDI